MSIDVLAFTDTYFPSINGVTYTIKSWKEEWSKRGNNMGVVYPSSSGYSPDSDEYPIKSIRFPFYEEFNLGVPYLSKDLPSVDVVHIHGQFTMGLAGLRYAHRHGVPVVASHHMFGGHYANYLSLTDGMEQFIRKTTRKYERAVYSNAETVLAPSRVTKSQLIDEVGLETGVKILPNGIDLGFFRPIRKSDFLSRHSIPTDKPIIGYTGRQGYEKDLFDIISAAEELDVTVVLGGNGPAHEDLRKRAEESDTHIEFLGFIDREELPELYSALDLFVFPSPVETQGLVALEAICCGTPVIGVNAGALADTIDHGRTGYLYHAGDIESFRRCIKKGINDKSNLRQNCINGREQYGIDTAIDTLESVYYDALHMFEP